MKTVYDALDPIVNGSATTKEKGDKYEAACVYYLKNDPFYALFFSRVGTIAQALEWDDCPVHDTQDNGIDLMAQTAEAGEWWAIQCKCYDGEKDLPKGICDSFFAHAAFIDGVDSLMVMTTAKALERTSRSKSTPADPCTSIPPRWRHPISTGPRLSKVFPPASG